MSEYQYYEFLAIDEALDARQMRELRALSTRARITPTGFVHTYHWGDFKGDPRVLMERYFDAFLYLVNWGTRLIMIRLPSSLLNLQMAGRYCRGASACAWQAGDKVVVELIQEGADDYWDEDDGTSLGLIVPARAELAAGDRRLLYLAWLLSVGAGEVADDELEPAVPVGLASLSPSLRTVSEFLHVDGDLLAAAAEASERPGTASLGAGECRPTRRDAASRRAKAPNPRCIFPAPTGDRDEGCPHRRCRTCPHRRCRTGLCLSVDLPPGPTDDLIVTRNLVIEPLSPRVGDSVTATFTVGRGRTGPEAVVQIKAGGREDVIGNACQRADQGQSWTVPLDSYADFQGEQTQTLAPGRELTYREVRIFDKPGRYFAEPVKQTKDGWGGIPSANRVCFSVRP